MIRSGGSSQPMSRWLAAQVTGASPRIRVALPACTACLRKAFSFLPEFIFRIRSALHYRQAHLIWDGKYRTLLRLAFCGARRVSAVFKQRIPRGIQAETI